MRISTLLLGVLVAPLFTACASIVSDSHQPITVRTQHENKEVNDATCTLSNSKGEWVTRTPQTTSVQKAYGDLDVTCRKDKLVGSKKVVSSATGSTYGNILLGGGIGALVDAGTGKGYEYPSNITIDLLGNIAP